MNFGATKEELAKTDPEREDTFSTTEASLGNAPNVELLTGEPTLVSLSTGEKQLSPKDNRDLQLVVSTTLEEFFQAVERVQKCTVKLNELSIEAESRMRLNG